MLKSEDGEHIISMGRHVILFTESTIRYFSPCGNGLNAVIPRKENGG